MMTMTEKPTILVVDDEEDIRELLEVTLRSWSYKTRTANNVDDALSRLKARGIDIVITDVRMPGRSGIELLSEIQEIAPQVETIVITGHGDMNTAIAAMRQGASDFLTKPIHRENLKLAVEKAVQRIAMVRRLAESERHRAAEETRRRKLEQDKQQLAYEAAEIETTAALLHNIGNALQNISGAAELLGIEFDDAIGDNRSAEADEARGLVDVIMNSSGLVNEILKVQQRTVLGDDSVEELGGLRRLLDDATTHTAELFRQSAITLETQVCEKAIGDVTLPAGQLSHALINLLRNSCEAIDRRRRGDASFLGKVVLTICAQGQGSFELRVIDNGCGFAGVPADRLFELGYTTHTANSKRGFGLHAVATLARSLGGSFGALSRAAPGDEEVGAEVWMVLPTHTESA